MLILSRRPGESIFIGSDIVVTVLGIKGAQVQVGVTAPKDIVVDRKEVHDRKLLESSPDTRLPTPTESTLNQACPDRSTAPNILSQSIGTHATTVLP